MDLRFASILTKNYFGDVQLPTVAPIGQTSSKWLHLEETLELKRFPLDKQVLQSLWIAKKSGPWWAEKLWM